MLFIYCSLPHRIIKGVREDVIFSVFDINFPSFISFFLLFSLTAPLVVVVVVVVVISFGGVQRNRAVVELNRSGPSCVAFLAP